MFIHSLNAFKSLSLSSETEELLRECEIPHALSALQRQIKDLEASRKQQADGAQKGFSAKFLLGMGVISCVVLGVINTLGLLLACFGLGCFSSSDKSERIVQKEQEIQQCCRENQQFFTQKGHTLLTNLGKLIVKKEEELAQTRELFLHTDEAYKSEIIEKIKGLDSLLPKMKQVQEELVNVSVLFVYWGGD